MAIAPITGMLRRTLILDLGTALGESCSQSAWRKLHFAVSPFAIESPARPETLEELSRANIVVIPGLGFVMGNVFWYGYHAPRTAKRDAFYAKLEEERASRAA
ncbi:cytochrome c oxidase subunit 7A [Rhypophila decipiens]|uniref:Cytochrome c oxidase subunit 7A n=1 Tax=Rhypophila decipiens TaxID=261697 RepID=A0AAN6YEI8_9PEZI|nr:cytochrome c oxidase subunit 7A [Rhypophila decipiens]